MASFRKFLVRSCWHSWTSMKTLDSSLFSVERDSGQPEGRKRTAQRFIAGSGQPGAVKSRRDDRNQCLRPSRAGILSSLRDFRAADSEPSDKSLGYFRSSLRDSRSGARHAEIHRWRDPRTLVPVKGILQGGVIATGSTDWKYVRERLTKGTASFGVP